MKRLVIGCLICLGVLSACRPSINVQESEVEMYQKQSSSSVEKIQKIEPTQGHALLACLHSLKWVVGKPQMNRPPDVTLSVRSNQEERIYDGWQSADFNTVEWLDRQQQRISQLHLSTCPGMEELFE